MSQEFSSSYMISLLTDGLQFLNKIAGQLDEDSQSEQNEIKLAFQRACDTLKENSAKLPVPSENKSLNRKANVTQRRKKLPFESNMKNSCEDSIKTDSDSSDSISTYSVFSNDSVSEESNTSYESFSCYSCLPVEKENRHNSIEHGNGKLNRKQLKPLFDLRSKLSDPQLPLFVSPQCEYPKHNACATSLRAYNFGDYDCPVHEYVFMSPLQDTKNETTPYYVLNVDNYYESIPSVGIQNVVMKS